MALQDFNFIEGEDPIKTLDRVAKSTNPCEANDYVKKVLLRMRSKEEALPVAAGLHQLAKALDWIATSMENLKPLEVVEHLAVWNKGRNPVVTVYSPASDPKFGNDYLISNFKFDPSFHSKVITIMATSIDDAHRKIATANFQN